MNKEEIQSTLKHHLGISDQEFKKYEQLVQSAKPRKAPTTNEVVMATEKNSKVIEKLKGVAETSVNKVKHDMKLDPSAIQKIVS